MITKVITRKQILIIENLANEIWREYYILFIGKEQVDYMLEKFQSGNAIYDQINNEGYIYYLIHEDGNCIGYFGVQPKEKELFLSKIYIKSAERGKGYGKKVIRFLGQLTKEKALSAISLTVNKNNSNAIKAYEKLGFKNMGSVVKDIGHGFIMDDYKMEKKV